MIHISGSIAYDRIMTFPDKFENHILPEKLHILNVSFMVDSVVERRGGTAGNIAYSLALLNEKPIVYSSVGKDFSFYAKAFESLGLSLDNIFVDNSTFTATCYITTDIVANQVTAFSPAAMLNKINPAFYPKVNAEKDWAILAPGNLEDMHNLSLYYNEHKVKVIADPGQQIVVLSKETVKEMLKSASILIGNDYEIAKICQSIDLTHQELLQQVDYLITTYGEKGSSVASKDFEKPIMIQQATPERVVDPTGCGDAYRAGLLKGLHNGLDIIDCAKIASVTASFCVEEHGTQEHSFTQTSFNERFEKTFKSLPPLEIFS